ncbi:hypothetical protein BDN71DRAFT_1495583 [Pleurotus eryngii]|uniref:Peptidase A1 domain-containing protein n=1 Tax=Pleurotus eryngii TaxID=5323 RepID=A0A9P5ZZI1_PLEER|nr:hypothetical protein BDN71DRAFT_1495583 [Pleurotus eryngii]
MPLRTSSGPGMLASKSTLMLVHSSEWTYPKLCHNTGAINERPSTPAQLIDANLRRRNISPDIRLRAVFDSAAFHEAAHPANIIKLLKRNLFHFFTIYLGRNDDPNAPADGAGASTPGEYVHGLESVANSVEVPGASDYFWSTALLWGNSTIPLNSSLPTAKAGSKATAILDTGRTPGAVLVEDIATFQAAGVSRFVPCKATRSISFKVGQRLDLVRRIPEERLRLLLPVANLEQADQDHPAIRAKQLGGITELSPADACSPMLLPNNDTKANASDDSKNPAADEKPPVSGLLASSNESDANGMTTTRLLNKYTPVIIGLLAANFLAPLILCGLCACMCIVRNGQSTATKATPKPVKSKEDGNRTEFVYPSLYDPLPCS